MCEVHLKDWEKASGGEVLRLAQAERAHRAGVDAGRRSRRRGSNARLARGGESVLRAGEATGRPLQMAISRYREYWDGGAADVEPEPLAFPA